MLLLISTQAFGARLPLADFSDAVQELAARSSSAVVQISVKGRKRVDEDSPRRAGYVAESQTKGSGVIVDPSGYIGPTRTSSTAPGLLM
jgi:hypothetical protein